MTQLTLPQAAKATGKDRSTLFRAIKSGRLSATKNAAGDYQVDVAELIRVYGALKAAPMRNDPPEGAAHPHAPAENPNATNELVREVEFLRLRTKELEADKAWLQAKVDELTPAVKLLTDQRQVQDAPKRSWWPWGK